MHIRALVATGLWVFATAGLHAQEYPTRVVRIITSGAGGGTDFTSRMIAQGLTTALGQQFIVENRASAVITGDLVAKSAPDGYTLLNAGASLWHGPMLANVPYDVMRDFTLITLVADAPNVLVVHPSLPAKSVKELVALARSRPGDLNFGSGGSGSSSHLSGELFRSMSKLNVLHVPYKGTGAVYNALLSGEVHVFFATPGGATPHMKSGRVRALAVTSAKPSLLFPDLPTVSASGLPGFESSAPHALVGPARMPAAVVARLQQEVTKHVARPEVRDRFLATGIEPIGGTPEQLAVFVKADIVRTAKVIREAGIRHE
jgi:tripartite-type tricarboxylate transporter receptor subunit TctC